MREREEIIHTIVKTKPLSINLKSLLKKVPIAIIMLEN
jgi:hypothetical protein